MREIGDEYVKKEWRLHKKAEPPFVAKFLIQWNNYLEQIKGLDPHSEELDLGTDLNPELIASLNDDQKNKLKELKEEVLKSA